MENAAAEITLATKLQFLPGVGLDRSKRFQKLGLRTVRDLLFLFPRDYELPAPPASVTKLREGVPASLVGTITDAEIVSRTPGRSVFGAIVENDTGAVRILFFNQPFRADQLTFDRQVMISGEPKLNGLRWEFVHPKVTFLDEADNDGSPPRPRILPIYPLTDGVKQADLRRLTRDLLPPIVATLTEVMPDRLRSLAAESLRVAGIKLAGALPPIDTALQQIHHPDDEQSLLGARSRFVFQELLVMQLALAMRRRKLTTDLQAPPLPSSGIVEARILKRFSFDLTGDQKVTIAEVAADMQRQFPMNRLLQGDVGSGKTVVAIYAMMLAVANEHQAVLMAPTEVLARQHYQTLRQTLADSRVRIGLLCGSLGASERRDVLQRTASGEIDLLVGTQALLSDSVNFAKLGLCVIDEQHKFGVGQRVALRSGGVDPHYLVMSATPIPRSVAMTLFGDVELSTLKEKPPGRGTVNTYLSHDGWRDRWWAFVSQQLDEGRQAFVVAPRVDAGETDSDDTEDIASVETIFAELSNGPLAKYKVGLLHGRMPNDEKQSIMQQFASGDLQVLVSTTVIEVGIDVPNATVMTILGAQRFGLAQLHQLRGRVSRGTHAGHVCVFTDGPQSPEENERLKVFEKTNDGFELAEADFRMRGPGDMLGRKQSGLPPMRIADLTEDVQVLAVAREIAQAMIDDDPELAAEDLTELHGQVMRRYGKRLELGDAS
ncbi:ATP-dependent DNA helicase RecG [Planctomycetes bacterium K23_9]|uniref:Probable DNA 3'-5' helicase RecG n=1 Tax=Stieleria marina TaxID=1930275 RepID=A0A517P2R8_9BACT|nr:ATP-dependent DNA helicase RecG [Planctomycetes bacterium K23_9]